MFMLVLIWWGLRDVNEIVLWGVQNCGWFLIVKIIGPIGGEFFWWIF
jgi:hypothetical protein